MKSFRRLIEPIIIYLTMTLVPGCATTVDFTYKVQKPAIVENLINGHAIFFFSITDLRFEKDLLGYTVNDLGMRVKKVKSRDPDISKSIYTEYKNILTRKGFIFTDDSINCDFKLKLSIINYYAETGSADVFSFLTIGQCCMGISLNGVSDKIELYKTKICGYGEKKTAMVLNKNDIPEALKLATDDVLDKILNGTELISYVSKNIKK
jgi:hypothetical protein